MEVFFETDDQWFLRALCALWPRPGILRVGRERLGRLTEAEVETLGRAVSAIPADRAWFSLNDEGWLLYVFGSQGLLTWAQQSKGRREQADSRSWSLKPEPETQ